MYGSEFGRISEGGRFRHDDRVGGGYGFLDIRTEEKVNGAMRLTEKVALCCPWRCTCYLGGAHTSGHRDDCHPVQVGTSSARECPC